jgi:hypothetical protein
MPLLPKILNVENIIQQYGVPALLGFLNGKTEAQYHYIMRQKPDFVSYYRDHNPGNWAVLMAGAKPFRPIVVDARREGRRVVKIIRSKGWKCYRHEYETFVNQISYFLRCLNA